MILDCTVAACPRLKILHNNRWLCLEHNNLMPRLILSSLTYTSSLHPDFSFLNTRDSYVHSQSPKEKPVLTSASQPHCGISYEKRRVVMRIEVNDSMIADRE